MAKRALGTLGLVCAIGALAACAPDASDDASAPDHQQQDQDIQGASMFAGEYADDESIERPDNRIWQASLRTDSTFTIFVQGLRACDTPGHECPMSWRGDGTRAGYTILTGRWALKRGATKSDLELALDIGSANEKLALPMKETQTFEPAPIDAPPPVLVLTGDLNGRLPARALYGKPRSIDEASLAGEWRVTNASDAEGMQPYLAGPRYPVADHAHTVTFDATKRSFRESISDEAKPLNEGTFALAAHPRTYVSTMLVLRSGNLTHLATIKKLTQAGDLELEVQGAATMHLKRSEATPAQ